MKTKALLLTTIFIDVIGIGIIIPVLPFYVKNFGVSDMVVTILFVIYALLSFLSAPYLGTLSDRFGRRPILVVSIISSAIGWFVFASARSVGALFMGRIIDGIAAGNATTAQSALADIARSDKERTINMGLFGALFGIGFIVGPALGGALATFGTTTPFYFVGFLSAINALLAYFFLPETHHAKNYDKRLTYNPFAPIRDGFRAIGMRRLFITWFIFGVAISIQQGAFAIYMARVFEMNAQAVGYLFTGIGVLILINQVVLLKRVWLTLGSKPRIAQIMLVVFGIGMILHAVPLFAVMIGGVVLATLGQGTLRTMYSSLIAGALPEKRGEYLGIATALMSLSMVIGPLIVTFVITRHPALPFIIAGMLAFVAFFLNYRPAPAMVANRSEGRI